MNGFLNSFATLFLSVAVLIWQVSVVAAADTIPTPSQPKASIAEKGFEIPVASGWVVDNSNKSTSLILLSPEDTTKNYRATLQVAVFNDAHSLSEADTKSFFEKIVKNFPEADSTISNYVTRGQQVIQLDNGYTGQMLYTSFNVGETDLMQMHVLVSSVAYHYLITFTDLSSTFENQENPIFQNAWAMINSVTLSEPVVESYFDGTWALIAALIVGAAGAWIFARKSRNKRFEAMLDEAESSDNSSDVPANSKVSHIASFKSRLSSRVSEVELDVDEDQGESDKELKEWKESA